MVEQLNRLARVQRQLLLDLRREPSPEEIAAEMDTTARKVRELLKVAQQPVSLETPLGEEQDSELGEFLKMNRPSHLTRGSLRDCATNTSTKCFPD